MNNTWRKGSNVVSNSFKNVLRSQRNNTLTDKKRKQLKKQAIKRLKESYLGIRKSPSYYKSATLDDLYAVVQYGTSQEQESMAKWIDRHAKPSDISTGLALRVVERLQRNLASLFDLYKAGESTYTYYNRSTRPISNKLYGIKNVRGPSQVGLSVSPTNLGVIALSAGLAAPGKRKKAVLKQYENSKKKTYKSFVKKGIDLKNKIKKLNNSSSFQNSSYVPLVAGPRKLTINSKLKTELNKIPKKTTDLLTKKGINLTAHVIKKSGYPGSKMAAKYLPRLGKKALYKYRVVDKMTNAVPYGVRKLRTSIGKRTGVNITKLARDVPYKYAETMGIDINRSEKITSLNKSAFKKIQKSKSRKNRRKGKN